jgi:hypothetical protein
MVSSEKYRVCVFCGASTGNRSVYVEEARGLGELLARRGMGLVFGGGNVGLMGAVADGALAAGGEVIGVIPGALVDRELAHRGVTRLEVVATMHERKQRMHELSHAFIALPGGFGTLDELFEALTWAQLGMHGKPIGLLSVANYWDGLVRMLDTMVEAGLLSATHRSMLLDEKDAAALLDRFAGYRAPDVKKWITPATT